MATSDDDLRAWEDAYRQSLTAPPGERYATFQELAPPDPTAQLVQQYFGQPQPSPAPAPPPAPSPPVQQMVQRSFGPPPTVAQQVQETFGAPAPAVVVPETTVTPRPGLPGTMPGVGSAAPSAGRAQLDAAMREAAGLGPREQPRRVGLTVQPFLPSERQQLGEAEDEAFAAQVERGEAEITRAEQVADRAVQAAEEQDQIDARFAAREMDRINQLRDRESRFQQMADELANQPIESPNLFGQEAGEQILNRIAVFLGTIGTGAGAPNLAYDKLQKDLERSLAQQRQKLELKAGRLKDEMTLYDMARQRFASEGAVDAVVRESAYRKLGAELNRFSEFAKTPERKAALDALIAQNNAQLTALEMERRKAMDADVLLQRRIAARAAGRPDPRKALLGKLKTEVGIKRTTEELTGAGAGQAGVTETQKGQTVLDVTARENAVRRLEDLSAQLKQKGRAASPFQRESIKRQAIDTWAILEGKKQMTKEEERGGKTALFAGSDATDTLDDYIAGQKREIDRQKRSLGKIPVSRKGKEAEAE